MNGVTISFDKTRTYINLSLSPSDFDKEVDERAIKLELEKGETKRLFVSDTALKSACDTANHYFKTGDGTVVQERIGERKNAEVVYRIPEDGMSANLVLTTPYGGKLPSLGTLKSLALKNNIRRGLGTKIIQSMLKEAKTAPPGTIIEKNSRERLTRKKRALISFHSFGSQRIRACASPSNRRRRTRRYAQSWGSHLRKGKCARIKTD